MGHECIQEDRIDRVETDFREHDRTSVPARENIQRLNTEMIHATADITFLKEQARTHKKEWEIESNRIKEQFLKSIDEIKVILAGDHSWIEEQKKNGNFRMNAIFNAFLCVCGGVTTALIIKMLK